MPTLSHEITLIRERSGQLRRFVTGLAAVLWIMLMLERLGAPALQALHSDGGAATAAALRQLASAIVGALPEAVYLLALSGVGRALGEFERGRLYAPTVSAMLERIGALLALGAGLSVFVVPGVQRALGAGPGYWIAFDLAALVLGALGLALTVIARIFGRAAELEAELAEIF